MVDYKYNLGLFPKKKKKMSYKKRIITSCFIFFICMTVSSQETKLTKSLDAKISKLHQQGKFSGTVLYAKNNQILLHKGYGFANRELKVKNAPKFKYNLGSINKLFTKIAIAKLIQEKKIKLNDLAIKYVPELYQKDTDKITIDQLLKMTSGFGDYLSDLEFINNRRAYTQMSDYLPIILKKELHFTPGSSKRYSNVGFELLGIIVERVSKINYYDFVQKNIFDIAKMPNTGYYTINDKESNLAIGYAKKDNKLIPNWNLKSYKGTAAGGGYSTSNDMLQLSNALLNNKLLDKVHTTLLFKKFDTKRTKYNYLGVAGGGAGINARIFINRDGFEVVVILSNIDPPSATEVNNIFKKLNTKK